MRRNVKRSEVKPGETFYKYDRSYTAIRNNSSNMKMLDNRGDKIEYLNITHNDGIPTIGFFYENDIVEAERPGMKFRDLPILSRFQTANWNPEYKNLFYTKLFGEQYANTDGRVFDWDFLFNDVEVIPFEG